MNLDTIDTCGYNARLTSSNFSDALELKEEIKKIIERWADEEDYWIGAFYLGKYEMKLIKESPYYGHAVDIRSTEGQYYVFDIPVFETVWHYWLGVQIRVRDGRVTNDNHSYPQKYSGEYYNQFSEQFQTIEQMKDLLSKNISEKEIYCKCGAQLEVEFKSDHIQVKPCPKCLEEKSKICPFWQLKV